MGSEQNFPIQIFESLPSNLDNSNYIDFLLFLAGLKPALRIKCKDYFKNALTKWCENYSFSFMISPEKYIYIATCSRVGDTYNSLGVLTQEGFNKVLEKLKFK